MNWKIQAIITGALGAAAMLAIAELTIQLITWWAML